MIFTNFSDSAVLERHVHVKVLNVDIKFTDSLLINLILFVHLSYHLSEICNVLRVFRDARCIFVNLRQLV